MRMVLFAIAIAAIVVYGEEPKPKTDSNHSHPTNAVQEPHREVSPTVIVVNENHSKGKAEDHPEKSPSYLSRLLSPENLPNIALVIVATLTAWFIASQARETANATQAMRDSLPHQEQAAQAALRNAEALINSERAWVMAELGWYENGLHIVHTTSQSPDGVIEATVVNVKLTCRNVGRSPAWIDRIVGRLDIVGDNSDISLMDDAPEGKLKSFGRIGPLGPNEQKSCNMELRCYGRRQEEQFLSAYTVIEYRDIFGVMRMTTLGYSIHNEAMYRQDGLPNRQRNT